MLKSERVKELECREELIPNHSAHSRSSTPAQASVTIGPLKKGPLILGNPKRSPDIPMYVPESRSTGTSMTAGHRRGMSGAAGLTQMSSCLGLIGCIGLLGFLGFRGFRVYRI